MQFDLSRFLTDMLAAYLECRAIGNPSNPRVLVAEQKAIVRLTARRKLRKQARAQGGSRREVKKFVNRTIETALEALAMEVDANFKHFN